MGSGLQFPTEQALEKHLYLAMLRIIANWHGQVYCWHRILNQLLLQFGDRILPEDLEIVMWFISSKKVKKDLHKAFDTTVLQQTTNNQQQSKIHFITSWKMNDQPLVKPIPWYGNDRNNKRLVWKSYNPYQPFDCAKYIWSQLIVLRRMRFHLFTNYWPKIFGNS